jgi:hypothetical protein
MDEERYRSQSRPLILARLSLTQCRLVRVRRGRSLADDGCAPAKPQSLA